MGKSGKFIEDSRVAGGLHRSKDGIYSVYWIWADDYKNAANRSEMKISPAFKETSYEVANQDLGFKRELIYAGTANNALTLSYREFVNNMARPAYTQELKYNFEPGVLIGFRGARIEVLEANNTSIRFKVISPLSLSN